MHAYAHINFFHQNPVKWIRPSTVNLTWRSNTRNCEAAMKVHNSLSSMLVSLENIKIKNTSSKMVPSSAYFFHFARVQHEKNTTQKTHISGHHMGQLNHGSIILTKVNRVHEAKQHHISVLAQYQYDCHYLITANCYIYIGQTRHAGIYCVPFLKYYNSTQGERHAKDIA